jgi:hypothetical protein
MLPGGGAAAGVNVDFPKAIDEATADGPGARILAHAAALHIAEDSVSLLGVAVTQGNVDSCFWAGNRTMLMGPHGLMKRLNGGTSAGICTQHTTDRRITFAHAMNPPSWWSPGGSGNVRLLCNVGAMGRKAWCDGHRVEVTHSATQRWSGACVQRNQHVCIASHRMHIARKQLEGQVYARGGEQ